MGNFLTDRPSSRVLAPPGGGASQIVFGDDSNPADPVAPLAPKDNNQIQSLPMRLDAFGGYSKLLAALQDKAFCGRVFAPPRSTISSVCCCWACRPCVTHSMRNTATTFEPRNFARCIESSLQRIRYNQNAW